MTNSKPEAWSPKPAAEGVVPNAPLRTSFFVLLALLGAFGACRREKFVEQQILIWKHVNTWSGRTSLQTESFPSDTGAFRVEWDGRFEPGASSGKLKVALHSAISGRPLVTVVEQEGEGHGTTQVSEDPREFYLVIETQRIDWTIKLDEGIRAVSRKKVED